MFLYNQKPLFYVIRKLLYFGRNFSKLRIFVFVPF